MRIRLTSVIFLVPLLIVVSALACSAATINFSSLSQGGSGLVGVGGSITQQGFTFTSGAGAFDVWGASSANLPGLLPANTSLFEFFAGSNTTLTDAGTPFTLNSIDLAPVLAGGTGTFSVMFTGTRPDATTVSETFTVTDSTPTALQTFHFSGFADLVSVSFTQGTNIGLFGAQDTAYQFDNVVLSTPEPGSLAFLGIGLFALCALYTRRANA